LEIDAQVVPIGIAGDGQIEVPDDVRSVGWYRFGPAPGDTGSAVLVGHVDDHLQGMGVLARIGDLNPGDAIEIDDAAAGIHGFTVVSREQWTKSQIPMGRLFDRGGQPRLVLITCGGAFDASRLQYDDNIAITAVPVSG
jgi:sortase (surface protein transpeptidase)